MAARTFTTPRIETFDDVQRSLDDFTAAFNNLAQRFYWGTGTPEGVVAAPVGSVFLRSDGGATTTLYVKTSGGSTNTGWTAK